VELAVVVGAIAALVTVATAAWATTGQQRRADELDQRLENLRSVTDPTLARLGPEEHDHELLRRLRRSLHADIAAFLEVDGHTLVVRAVSGADGDLTIGQRLDGAAGLVGRVLDEGEPLLLGDVRADQVGVAALRGRVRSFLGCPVLVRGASCGVLAVGSTRSDAFRAGDVHVARRAADRLGWSFEEARALQAEDAVHAAEAEAEHRVRTIVEVAPVGIVELTIDGGVRRWNRTAADLLGWPRWLVGATPNSGLPDDAVAAIERAAAGHRSDRIECSVLREGAPPVAVAASAAPVTDTEGTVEGVVLLLDDITERQQLEQHVRQAQRLDALARLAGGVAHDFNNLLTVIRGYGEVLLKTVARTGDARDDVDAILEASARASDLTKQLLAIGRRPAAEPEVLDVHRIVAELEPVLARLAGDAVQLRVVAASDAVGSVLIDRSDLDQSVMNLVTNARDAMADGGTLVVESRSLELRSRSAALAGVEAGPYVLITVADTGSGMPREVLEHCFDPFFTTKARGRGSGIGLATVYGTITQAGGHVTVESAVGRGTTFRLWLPLATASASSADDPSPKARPKATARTGGGRTGRTPRVLLVEDEAMVRTLARATLEAAGYQVVEADSAESALAKVANEEPFDVVVSDVVLGGMTGDALAMRLRRNDPVLRVVLMSGFTNEALAVTPDVFLTKPFAFEDLAAAVRTLVPVRPTSLARATARSGSRRRAP
jgi:PAS domain S-box-containing protein